MRCREITVEHARAALVILKEECGYTSGGEDFVRVVSTEGKSGQGICAEYRFMGALGFGGKFRNNGNLNNTPYVDCYPENETPERLSMIDRANERLAALFSEQVADDEISGSCAASSARTQSLPLSTPPQRWRKK